MNTSLKRFQLCAVASFFAVLSAAAGCKGSSDKASGADLIPAKMTSDSKIVTPYLSGLNTQSAAGPDWHDPKFLSQIKALSPGNLRYPGGTIGNYMDWRTGKYMKIDLRDPNKGPARCPIKGPQGTDDINTYRPEEFKLAVDACGATPIVMANILTDTLGSTREMLFHMQKMGMPVEFVELGNEFFFTWDQGGNEAKGILGDYALDYHFPTARSYAQEVNRWIKELKKDFPQTKFAYCASKMGMDRSSSARTAEWNRVTSQLVEEADAVILHYYSDMRGAKDPIDGISKSLIEYKKMENFMAESFPGKKIWFTEYGNRGGKSPAGEILNPWYGFWGHGIHISLITTAIMMMPQVEISCVHNIAAEPTFALIFPKEDLIPAEAFGKPSLKVTPLELSAVGLTHQLLWMASSGAEKMTRMEFPGVEQFTCSKGSLPALHGFAFEKAGSYRFYLVNLSDKPVRIVLSDLPGHPAYIQQYYAPSLLTPVTGEKSVSMKKERIKEKKEVLLSPFSVSTIY